MPVDLDLEEEEEAVLPYAPCIFEERNVEK
jgi:hypothetical protein